MTYIQSTGYSPKAPEGGGKRRRVVRESETPPPVFGVDEERLWCSSGFQKGSCGSGGVSSFCATGRVSMAGDRRARQQVELGRRFHSKEKRAGVVGGAHFIGA
jgi:hypothetical protein